MSSRSSLYATLGELKIVYLGFRTETPESSSAYGRRVLATRIDETSGIAWIGIACSSLDDIQSRSCDRQPSSRADRPLAGAPMPLTKARPVGPRELRFPLAHSGLPTDDAARQVGCGFYRPPGAAVAGDDPSSIWNWILRFSEWQEQRNYSRHTIETRARTLRVFAGWAGSSGIFHPEAITEGVLDDWQRRLFRHRKPNGDPLAVSSRITHTQPLRAFMRWLAHEGTLPLNIAERLEMPRSVRCLPRHIMTVGEVERVLSVSNTTRQLGIRDRAMLEVLYSTGVRRQELLNLKLYDLDRPRGVLMVRQGKGKKDRVIPIGARAMVWVDRYMAEVRPDLSPAAYEDTLFLGRSGTPMSPARLAEIVRACIDAASIGKRGSCHMFRHTMATLMLENGADIRFIQLMLGHADLSSTQIYTQVSIPKLKEVHTATHPGAV